MTINPIEILQKTKMETTGLDELVMAGWIIGLLVLGTVAWVLLDQLHCWWKRFRGKR